ncbi:MAG: hypothetical protein WBF44_19155, partial [Pseudolabrys sp.]
VGSARVAEEAEGASRRLIKLLIGFRRDRREGGLSVSRMSALPPKADITLARPARVMSALGQKRK